MFSLIDLFAYVIALGIAAAIPGPGMTALVAKSVTQGPKAGFAMLSGLICGDLTYLLFAVFGLTLAASHFASIFEIIRWASVGYLVYLAWQFWRARPAELEAPDSLSARALSTGFLSGYSITLANPKTIGFYLALLPLVLELSAVALKQWAFILVPSTIVVLAIVGGIFVLAAVALRSALQRPVAHYWLHKSASIAMFSAAASIALRR